MKRYIVLLLTILFFFSLFPNYNADARTGPWVHYRNDCCSSTTPSETSYYRYKSVRAYNTDGDAYYKIFRQKKNQNPVFNFGGSIGSVYRGSIVNGEFSVNDPDDEDTITYTLHAGDPSYITIYDSGLTTIGGTLRGDSDFTFDTSAVDKEDLIWNGSRYEQRVYIRGEATDDEDAKSWSNLVFTVYNHAPILDVLTSDGITLDEENHSFSIDGKVSDPDGGNLTILAESDLAGITQQRTVYDGSSTKPFTLNFDLNIDSIPSGSHTLKIIAIDEHEGKTTKTFSFTVEAPVVTESNAERICGSDAVAVQNEYNSKINRYKENDASIPERYTISFIQSIANVIGINSIPNLLLGNPYCVWNESEDGTLVYSTFTNEEMEKIIKPMVQFLTGLYVFFVTLAILISTLKMGFKGFSPASRADIWQDVNMWILSAFFMLGYWVILNELFVLNEGILGMVKQILTDSGISYKNFSIIPELAFGSLADIMLFFGEWALAFYLNIVYIGRKVLIMLLVMLSPLASISLIFSSTRQYFSIYLRSLIGLIFLQAFHALLFLIFVLLANVISTVDSTLFKLGMLIMFIPITSMVLNWVQLTDSSSGLMKPIAGAPMMAARVLANSKSKLSKTVPPPTMNPLVNAATGKDSGITKISHFAEGATSPMWGAAKKAAGYTGLAVGAGAGLVLGPAGSMVGAKIGQSVGSGAMQLGRNTVGTAKGVKDSISKAKEVTGTTSFKELKGALKENEVAKREFSGNIGESIGSLVGAGAMGRQIGHAQSGVSQSRLMNEKFGINSSSDLAALHPGSDIVWQQTNENSGFYKKEEDGNLKLVSPLGAADPSLKDGVVRRMDYKTSNGSPFERLPDGTYKAETNPYGTTGSTPNLLRNSEPYIQGEDGNRYTDTRMNPETFNPDTYFNHNVAGAPLSEGDRVADSIHQNSLSGWKSANDYNSIPRKSDVL